MIALLYTLNSFNGKIGSSPLIVDATSSGHDGLDVNVFWQ